MLIKLPIKPLNLAEAAHSLLVKFMSEISAQEIRCKGLVEVLSEKC